MCRISEITRVCASRSIALTECIMTVHRKAFDKKKNEKETPHSEHGTTSDGFVISVVFFVDKHKKIFE